MGHVSVNASQLHCTHPTPPKKKGECDIITNIFIVLVKKFKLEFFFMKLSVTVKKWILRTSVVD